MKECDRNDYKKRHAEIIGRRDKYGYKRGSADWAIPEFNLK
jgi:hypothetical protein